MTNTRNEENKAIFDELIETGVIEHSYDAYLVGIGVGRAEERNKHMIGE